MTTVQKQAIIAVFSALTEAVKVTGDRGVPGGVLYSALSGKLTLDQFQQFMGALVAAGNLRKQGELYFYIKG